jgi:hypothetical protein
MEVTKWLKPITQSATGFNERRALWLQVCRARDGLRGRQALTLGR